MMQLPSSSQTSSQIGICLMIYLWGNIYIYTRTNTQIKRRTRSLALNNNKKLLIVFKIAMYKSRMYENQMAQRYPKSNSQQQQQHKKNENANQSQTLQKSKAYSKDERKSRVPNSSQQPPLHSNTQEYYLHGKINPSIVPTISAKAWIIMDTENGNIIWAKNENARREMASITKVMTCFLALEMCEKMEVKADSTYISVSKQASSTGGTSAELCEGDIISIDDLYYGLMLPSGNDAAMAIAENFGVYCYYQSKEFQEQFNRNGSTDLGKVRNPINYFLREMNDKAKKLGMSNTTYANPHGLINKQNKSTPHDLAKLCMEVMKNAKFRQIVNTKMHFCQIQEEDGWTRDVFWENTNRLLYHGFHGIKTGITTEAGPCLSSAYKTKNKTYAIVVLNCESMDGRWSDTIKLLEWAISVYEGK